MTHIAVTALSQELKEAEAALAKSIEAMRTHGHQKSTWLFLRHDGERVRRLREAVAAAEEQAP